MLVLNIFEDFKILYIIWDYDYPPREEVDVMVSYWTDSTRYYIIEQDDDIVDVCNSRTGDVARFSQTEEIQDHSDAARVFCQWQADRVNKEHTPREGEIWSVTYKDLTQLCVVRYHSFIVIDGDHIQIPLDDPDITEKQFHV